MVGNWQKDKIIEYFPSIIDIGSTIQNMELKYFRRTIASPENYQLWFYYIQNKNIIALKSMLADKVTHINLPNPNDGETIVHRSVRKRSLNLLDFCIKNNANFNVKSMNEEETPFFEICYPYVGFKIFKKVLSTVNESEFKKIIIDQNILQETILEKLCSNDRNVKKLQWIEKRFFNVWSDIKKDRRYYNYLISVSEEHEAKEITFFLKGLQKIRNDLQRELKTNKVENKTNKI